MAYLHPDKQINLEKRLGLRQEASRRMTPVRRRKRRNPRTLRKRVPKTMLGRLEQRMG